MPSDVQNAAFEVTITFTEAVSGFTQSGLSVGGTASVSITAWSTTDNTTFTAEVTPTGSGQVTLSIAADVATDAANNPNTAATSQTVRGMKYLRETLKILPQKPDPIVIDEIAERLGSIGAIHHTPFQLNTS